MKDLFDYRNVIAHGKPEDLENEGSENWPDVLNGPVDFIKTKWELYGTEINATKAKEDVLKIAKILYENANLKHGGPRGPFSFGFQIRRTSLY